MVGRVHWRIKFLPSAISFHGRQWYPEHLQQMAYFCIAPYLSSTD